MPTILRNADTLLSTGLILEVIGAVLYLRLPQLSAWVLIVGGALVSLSYMISRSGTTGATVREKRLDQMGFVSGLCYLVAGGFALDGQRPIWILLFVIATVLAVYSIFVKDSVQKKA